MPHRQHIDIPAIEQFYRIEDDGAIFSHRKHKYLKPTFNTAGYLYVAITLDTTMYIAVHRLVATKYIGQCPPGLETSHKDGIKANNHYSNLEYLTHSQNILKSYQEHGRVSCANGWHRECFSDATKELMSNTKKKRIKFTFDGMEAIFPSIDDASQSLNTYRKKIYRCIKDNTPFTDKNQPDFVGILSFVDV